MDSMDSVDSMDCLNSVLNMYTVSFVGHRDLSGAPPLSARIEEIVEKLLRKHEMVEFYIGRTGDFDILAASCIKRVQKRLGEGNCELVLVQPYHMRDEEYYEVYYDNILIPVPLETHYKSAYGKRNDWMLDRSDLLVAFVQRKEGGAYTMMKRAQRRGIPVINLADVPDEDED